MTLFLHRADRTDVLADALAELLATPLADPFESDVVVVPAKGVERWLSQRLSHRLGTSAAGDDGVCAGVSFRSPRSLIAEVLGGSDDDPWAPDALAWPLLGVIDSSLGEPWCRTLSLHLGYGDPSEEGELRRGRRYAVARRLAGLFASYAAQRPAMLAAWEVGQDSDGAGGRLDDDLVWQAELWRRLVAAVAVPTPSVRLAGTVAVLQDDPGRLDLPGRLSLFGHTRIQRTEAELLKALGSHRDVHLWLPHPSPALWSALGAEEGVVPRADDLSHVPVEHPLLASLGRDLRELERVVLPLVDVDADAGAAGSAARGDDLLGWLQSDLVANRAPAAEGRRLDPADDSVQVHGCHGPARQVEVLREAVLGLLARHGDLEPRDVVVMCPDIEAYAPLIQAAFGMTDGRDGGHPAHRLSVRLADRSLTQTNPLLGVLGQVLDLAGGRAEASRVRDLMATEPVRRRFGFTESDLESVDAWIEEAGIRWAFDEAHREEYGLAAYLQNTWRFGLDRILAGVAVSDDAGRWFGTTLPLDDVGSTSIDLAGRLAEFVDRLSALADRFRGSHPLEHWISALGDVVGQLTAVGWGEEWQHGEVNRELAAIRAGATGSGGADLRLADLRSLLGERLAGRPTRANFRTGTLTVCTMVPMRSVPHRVVCLLGLDDGVFPRAGVVDGDDVLARRPLIGERDARSEDRQLMLDAVLAAQEHLLITYTAANETTGRPRPASVPLDELLDALDATVAGGRAHALRKHPLQATGARNFDPAPERPLAFEKAVPFSFDAAALAGARVAVLDRPDPERITDVVLEAREGDVDLADLVRFLKDPVKEFLKQRLQVGLPDDGEEAADGIPVDLNGLERWQVGDRLLRDLLAGRSREDALATEWRRGVLPPGRLGWKLARDLADQAQPLAEAAESFRAGLPLRAVDIDLPLSAERRLRGTVTDLYGERLVRVNFSSLGAKHVLDAWVPLLALCAAHPTRSWSAGAIGRGRGRSSGGFARATFGSVQEAPELLADLVALYDAGMREPLPLPLKTGRAWASHRKYRQQARMRADQEWRQTRYGPENAEPAHVLVWGKDAALDVLLDPVRAGEEYDGESTRLGAFASRLWVPILGRQR